MTILVDFDENICYVVMELAVQNEQDFLADGLSEKPSFGECVWLEKALRQRADFQLVFQTRTVQRGEIEIERCGRYIRVKSVFSEDI